MDMGTWNACLMQGGLALLDLLLRIYARVSICLNVWLRALCGLLNLKVHVERAVVERCAHLVVSALQQQHLLSLDDWTYGFEWWLTACCSTTWDPAGSSIMPRACAIPCGRTHQQSQSLGVHFLLFWRPLWHVADEWKRHRHSRRFLVRLERNVMPGEAPRPAAPAPAPRHDAQVTPQVQ